MARAWRRARTYLTLRTHPDVRAEALAEADRLLDEAVALERTLQLTTNAVAEDGR